MKDSNMFKCDLCHFNCANKRTLFLHKAKTHFYEVKFKFKCNICRVGYSSRETYAQHVKIIHKDNGSRFKCIVKYKNQGEGNEIVEYECGKTFQILNSARRHLQILHKIQTKSCEESKKYFKIVTIKKSLFRPKYSIYGGNQHQPNQNQNLQNENNEEIVSPVVDDPDEILKILENNETEDVESQVPYSSENICIIEEKFIPDVTFDDIKINIDEISDKTDEMKQNKEKDIKIKKSFVQKLTGKSKLDVKKKKLVNLQSNKLTITKPQQVPKRASLSRSCKNSVEILQTSTSQFDSETESENESELFKSKSKSLLKVKSHYVVKGTLIKHHKDIINRSKSKKFSDLVSESESEPKFESESDTDFEPEPEVKSKIKSSQKDKNQNSHSCHICQKKFPNPARLRRHLICSLHPENRVECTKCPESHYVVKGTLVEHDKDVKYVRKRLANIPKSQMSKIQHTCTRCHKVFNKRNLPRHLEHYCNVTEKKFKCTECNTSFKAYETYTRHLKDSSRHGGPNRGKRYMCEQCSSGFTRAGSLKKHIQARHENDGTRFECHICCRSYGRVDSLGAHLKTEEHKLREQDFQKKNQNQVKKVNPNIVKVKIKKEK